MRQHEGRHREPVGLHRDAEPADIEVAVVISCDEHDIDGGVALAGPQAVAV